MRSIHQIIPSLWNILKILLSLHFKRYCMTSLINPEIRFHVRIPVNVLVSLAGRSFILINVRALPRYHIDTKGCRHRQDDGQISRLYAPEIHRRWSVVNYINNKWIGVFSNLFANLLIRWKWKWPTLKPSEYSVNLLWEEFVSFETVQLFWIVFTQQRLVYL